MAAHRNNRGTCQICHRSKPANQLLPAKMVRDSLVLLIKKDHPDWDEHGNICFDCLNRYRSQYVQQMMEKELGELDELEQEVAKGLAENELLSENLNEQYEEALSFGDRVADKVAEFGGSWSFIFVFAAFMLAWIVMNSVVLFWQPFDPYPFILLNLMLSLLAAVQAPIIMMSQNRQEDRDRLRAENDYQVNLKSELEVRLLNEKIDQLIHQQMRRFMEIQQFQMDMLNEIGKKIR